MDVNQVGLERESLMNHPEGRVADAGGARSRPSKEALGCLGFRFSVFGFRFSVFGDVWGNDPEGRVADAGDA